MDFPEHLLNFLWKASTIIQKRKFTVSNVKYPLAATGTAVLFL